MSTVLIYFIAALLAVALDLLVIRWARQRRPPHRPGEPEARFLGSVSPILTWLKYGRRPAPPRATPRPACAEKGQAEPLLAVSATPSTGRPGIEIDLKVRLHLPTLPGRPRLYMFKWPGAGQRSAWITDNLEQVEWVAGAVVLAGIGQVFVSYQWLWPGIGAYAAALALTGVWAYRQPAARERLIEVATLSRRAETWLLIGLIALAAVARYYELDQRIYGIDGDEKNWTLQSYFSVVQGEERGEFLIRHFRYLPVTFYLQGWAMQLFGLSFLTPRYLNATMSLLSIALFYVMLRRMTNPPTALVGGLLAGLAFAELSAGRQAIHSTLIELWVVLAYLALLGAVQSRDWRSFLVAGLVTAVGMLTYETFYLTPVVALAYLGVCAWRDRTNWSSWLKAGMAFVLPLLFVLPSTMEYIGTRQGYHLKALRAEGDLSSALLTRLVESADTLFHAVKWTDQLVRWGDGPIFNVLLLPFFVIGLGYVVATWKKSHAVFLAVWFVLQFFPFGVLGAPFPRVFYPALMAVAGLAAVGLMAALRAARQVLRLNSRALSGVLAAVLITAVGYDIHVFTRLDDIGDQQKRRELADLVRASAAAAPVTYLSYLPFAGEVIAQERDLIEFSVAGAREQDPDRYFTLLPLDRLLARLWDERGRHATANVILDKTTHDLDPAQRQAARATLARCYPHVAVQSGRFFDVYMLPADDLQNPACYSTAALALDRPDQGTPLTAGQPVTFEWRTAAPAPLTFRLWVEQHNPQVIWLEAEDDFSQNEGWYTEAAFAAGYSGDGYLTDTWHAGRAAAQVDMKQAGAYRLWVRTHRRVINDHHNFISMDEQPPVEIAPPQALLHTWVWQTAGEYTLDRGPHTLTLTRVYGQDPQYTVFIDAVALSADPAFDPGRDTPWRVLLDTGEQLMTTTTYTLQPGLPEGRYRWQIRLFDGERLVDWIGQRGIGAGPREFETSAPGQP